MLKTSALILSLFFCSFSSAHADENNIFEGRSYGSFLFFDKVPNALFFEGPIEKNDSFEFRKAIRNHEIDTIVLSSPGGVLFEGLTIAGMIFDKKLKTYVPTTGRCASACSFMFFAGDIRQANGKLGVHQFYSDNESTSAEIAAIEAGSQFTVSEIIGFLNEFNTPASVYEKMFANRQMYYFSNEELAEINSADIDDESVSSFSEIDDFLAKAIESRNQKKLEQEQVVIVEESKITNEVYLRKKIQSELNRIGCSLGKVDGIIGPASKKALARFNSQNSSSYDFGNFFQSEEVLNMLLTKAPGFCPPIKQKKSPKVSETNVTTWSGYDYCTVIDGKRNQTARLFKLSDSTFELVLSNGVMLERKFVLTKDKAGKYRGKSGTVTVNLDINLQRGIMKGKAHETNLAMRALFAALLVSGYCDLQFIKNR